MTTILLDMDGPLADFDTAFWEAATEAGFDFGIPSLEHQLHRFMTDHLPRHLRDEAQAIVQQPGWFDGLPITSGAEEGVYDLLEAGVDLWVCTKPLESNPTCLNDKAAWINRYFPDLRDRLITAPDKSMIKGDLLLDDAIKLDWIERAEWSPMVFTVPFNGPHSKWADLPHWSWSDPIETLLEAAS